MILSFLCALLVLAVNAAPHTTRRTFERMLPTRGGVKLHTRIVLPDDSDAKFPTIVDRSPYGYDDLEWIPDIFVPAGFATVGQDIRGTGLSEGNFTFWHSDASDAEDLGDWIIKQPWSNGVIHSFGASADGVTAFRTNYNVPKWLQNQYYIWTSSNLYAVAYPNGAYLADLWSNWVMDTVREEESEGALETLKQNEMYNSWWEPMDMTGKYHKLIKEGTVSGFWGGWYDILLIGTLGAYEGFNRQQLDSTTDNSGGSVLTVDPLGHCQTAASYFPQNLLAGRSLLPVMQVCVRNWCCCRRKRGKGEREKNT